MVPHRTFRRYVCWPSAGQVPQEAARRAGALTTEPPNTPVIMTGHRSGDPDDSELMWTCATT